MDEIEKYLQWKASYATAAARNYRQWLLSFHNYLQKDISQAEIGEYVSWKEILSLKYAPKTMQLAVISIRDFYKWLHDCNIKCLRYTLIKVPKAEARSYVAVTQEEYDKMLAYCYRDTYRELQKIVIIRLLWDTGMRVSELCELNLSSLNLPAPDGVVCTKKNRQQRMIFWSKDTHELLLSYLGIKICCNNYPALFSGIYSHTKNDCTKRIHCRTVQRIIKEKCRQAGIIRPISPHSFRHAKAHRILERYGSMADVQQLLGHLSINSSAIYVQRNNLELKEIAQRYL